MEDGTKTDFHVFFVNSPSLISGVTVVFKKKLKIDFTSSIFLWQRHGTEKRESFVPKRKVSPTTKCAAKWKELLQLSFVYLSAYGDMSNK